MRFEDADESEIFVKTFQEDIRKYLKGKRVISATLKRKEYFVVPEDVYNNFKKMRRNPYSVGFYIGESKRNFKIGLEFGWILSTFVKHHRVWLNESGARAFLRGQNIKREKIIVKKDKNLGTGDYILVLNEEGDYLGLGRVRAFKPFMIKNIIDKGWYVRQSTKKPERARPRKAPKSATHRRTRRKRATSRNTKVGRKPNAPR